MKLFRKSGITESSLFFQRQRILYSLNSLIPVREKYAVENFLFILYSDIKMYMPESTKSPRMVFLEEQKSLKMPRFHFDQGISLIIVKFFRFWGVGQGPINFRFI